jgi:DNA-binding GntR family transcriptional regulator
MPADQACTVPVGPAQGPPGTVPIPYSRFLTLKRSGPEPLYYQLAQSIESAITAGHIGHGTKLPALAVLASELHLAPQTVRAAWNYLERRGVLTCRHGVGTVVS